MNIEHILNKTEPNQTIKTQPHAKSFIFETAIIEQK